MRDAVAAGVVFAVAFGLRSVYLGDIAGVPFVEHPLIDARIYDAWAARIADGDWLGDGAFYQAPAYPYFLAGIYALFGRGLSVVHWVQMGLGSLSCVWMFLAASTLFDRRCGWVAGLGLALYAPAIYFDGIIGKSVLALFLTTLLLWCLLRFQRTPTGWGVATAGILAGILALTRENALVFVLAVPVWIALRFRHEDRRRVASWCGAFLLGASLLLGPVALRNAVLGDTFALTTSQVGTNFYIGNNPHATGLYTPLFPGRHTPDHESPDATRLAEEALGRSLTRGEVSNYWLKRGLEFVRDQPGQFLSLLAWKTLLTWNDVEISDTEDLYVYAEWSPMLRALLGPSRFGVLAPLAVLGVILCWRERREVWLLLWLAGVFTAAVALFLVFARFRLPLVPLLMPLAALGLVRGARLIRSRDLRRLAPAVAAALLMAVVVNWPVFARDQLRVGPYLNLAYILRSDGRDAEAESYLMRSFEIAPDNLEVLLRLAALRLDQERVPEAEILTRRMISLRSEDYRGHRLLANVLARQGRLQEARRERQIARALGPERQRSPRWNPAPREP